MKKSDEVAAESMREEGRDGKPELNSRRSQGSRRPSLNADSTWEDFGTVPGVKHVVIAL